MTMYPASTNLVREDIAKVNLPMENMRYMYPVSNDLCGGKST